MRLGLVLGSGLGSGCGVGSGLCTSQQRHVARRGGDGIKARELEVGCEAVGHLVIRRVSLEGALGHRAA